MKLLTLSLTLPLLAGCAAKSYTETADNQSKPSWAKVADPLSEKDGKLYFVGFIEVDGNSSKSAALNMSDEKAMSEPMRAAVDQFLDQNQVGEELRKDDQFGRRIISATRGYRPPMPTLQITSRFWEKSTVLVEGYPGRGELRVYSLAVMTKADYEEAKQAYLAHLRGDPAVKKILEEVGAKQRELAMTSK